MQSICDQLLYEKSAGQRELRNLKFIWIERDPVLVQHVEFVKSKEAQFGVGKDKQVEEKETPPFSDEPIDGSVGIATQLMTLFPPGKTTDAELEVMYANGGLPADDETFQIKDNDNQTPSCEECPPLDLTGNNKTIDTCDDSVVNAKIIDDVKPKKVTKQTLDMQIYLTGDSKTSETVPFARFGRPDIKALFDEMRNDAIASGDKKVAVCVSAPHKLMSLCHKACVLYSDETVRFDFHSEAMAV